MSVDVVRRRSTVDEYLQMVEAGILTKQDRVELLDGEIVEMTPGGPPHGAAIAALIRLLSAGLGSRSVIWLQFAVRLLPRSMPEPDLALLRPRSYRAALPTSGDVLLVVEVADSSLRRDRGLKLPLYARAGIPEYWIVNVQDDVVEVYWDPAGSVYTSLRRVGRGESISPAAFPDLHILVDDILA